MPESTLITNFGHMRCSGSRPTISATIVAQAPIRYCRPRPPDDIRSAMYAWRPVVLRDSSQAVTELACRGQCARDSLCLAYEFATIHGIYTRWARAVPHACSL
eukprot:4685786-Pleurochrysis_carterae.AAC.2